MRRRKPLNHSNLAWRLFSAVLSFLSISLFRLRYPLLHCLVLVLVIGVWLSVRPHLTDGIRRRAMSAGLRKDLTSLFRHGISLRLLPYHMSWRRRFHVLLYYCSSAT
ncbi:hypothetical protein BJX64DRAFT_13476 [Aspergillus heterothallicus]